MSERNVQLVRGIFEAGNAESKEAILAALPELIPQLFDPKVEFVETPERVDARTYHGHDGVRQAFERWLEQWEDYRAELVSVEDHGNLVLATVREHATGIVSGAGAANTLYVVFTFRDGKVSRYEETYEESRARALTGSPPPRLLL